VPIGFIGAYTTFSTFEYETLRAMQEGQLATGLLNVALSVIAGFGAVWLGDVIGKVFV
jgi:CrcB protein